MQLPQARAPPSAPTSQALAGFTRIETTGVGAFGLRPLYCPWPRFVDTPPWRGPSHCALCALRRTSGGATMTIPGGAGTTHPPVLGAPASIIGSEPPQPPVRGSDLLSQIETFVTLCGMVGLRGGLRA